MCLLFCLYLYCLECIVLYEQKRKTYILCPHLLLWFSFCPQINFLSLIVLLKVAQIEPLIKSVDCNSELMSVGLPCSQLNEAVVRTRPGFF